jgi:two-component system, OmpR family, sensor kinase
MSLRRRLLFSLLLLLVVLALGGVTVVRAQRAYLVDQVDEQLEIVRPTIAGASVGPDLQGELGGRDIPQGNFSLALLAPDGTVTPFLEGGGPLDTPELSNLDQSTLSAGVNFTADAVESGSQVRVMSIARAADGNWLIVAFPLDNVNDAQRRLIVSLLALGLVIGVSAACVAWWIHRLGLRPIEQLTRVSSSMVAGDRSQRSATVDPNTEAGKLGLAFNLMLDERDDVEDRLRRFVADASHELRTPLTSVRGFLDAFASGRFETEASQADAVRRMTRETLRMQHLVEDLLVLADTDRQRPLRRTHVDVGLTVRDIVQDAQAIHPSRRIDITVPVDPLMITADLIAMQQIVAALVDNALTHTFDDTIVRCGVDRQGDDVVISVIDDGPGVRPEEVELVFERFYRADASRTRHGRGGSGLGLSIVKSLVEAHGGSISLHSPPNQGCQIQVRLPA